MWISVVVPVEARSWQSWKDSEKEERDTEKGSGDEDARETRFSDTVASMMENDKERRIRLNGGRLTMRVNDR